MNTARALELEIARRPKPDGKQNPAGLAGWHLERERTSRAISLAEAAKGSNISISDLIALEHGKLTRLSADKVPGMVAAYGRFLGFEAEPLVAHYRTLLEQIPRVVPLPVEPVAIEAAPRPRARRRWLTNRNILIGSAASMAAIFAITGVILAVQHVSAPDTQPASAKVEPVEVQQPTATTAPAAALPVAEAPQAEPQPTALDGLGDLINRTIAAVDASGIGPRAEVMPARGSLRQPPFATDADGKRIFGAENTDSRITLTARQQVWLRVEDATGNVVATITFAPGDQYRVPNREDLVVIARDGGLIDMSVDGKPRGSLGGAGEILVGKPLKP